MPIALLVAALLLLIVLCLTLLLPLSILMRYRAGSARRRAWSWVASINLLAATFSAALLVVTAAISDKWVPGAFHHCVGGLAAGMLLGIVGLLATRWEPTASGLFYRPSRLLILLLTVVVTSRILYGFWRAWTAWRTTAAEESWLAESGAAGSIAAGAAVLGYYVVYWLGLRRRARQHARR